MIEINGTSCCGIDEISEISKKENTAEMIIKHIIKKESLQAHYNFSDVIMRGKKMLKSNGIEMAKLIKKHKLGTIIQTPPARNPNSGHIIRQWTWTPDRKAYREWYRQNKERIPDLETDKYNP